MADWRTTELSDYQRQMTAGQLPRGSVLQLAPNKPGCWDIGNPAYSAQEVPASFSWPLMPGIGAQLGADGLPISYAREFSPKLELQLKLSDYDIALIDTLKSWLYQREKLRIFAWGEFILLGYLGEIPIDRPYTEEFVASFIPLAAAIYKAEAARLDCAVTGGSIPLLNLPWPGYFRGSYYPAHQPVFAQGCHFINATEFSL